MFLLLQLKLSGDFFEGLSAEAYDLGAVAEDCEHTMDDIGEQEEFTLPPYQEVKGNRIAATNKTFMFMQVTYRLVCLSLVKVIRDVIFGSMFQCWM